MGMTLEELAGRIGAKVQGESSRVVSRCAGLEEAGPEEVSFLANRKYAKLLAKTQAGAVVVSPKDAADAPAQTLLIAEDPYFAFREAVVALHGFRKHPAPGIDTHAFVDPTAEIAELCTVRPFVYIAPRAKIGKRCVIYPHCYIGKDAVIGDDCILYPNVTVYDQCVLGNRVTLHAGCVIGQDGLGYAMNKGAWHKIPQIGNVVLEDDVELGANCAIDRATVGSTRIGQGTKFSDLVAIGHGTKVGKHNMIVAQVGLAGSVETGSYVTMGGQVGVAGHLSIGDQVQIAAKAGVMTDLAAKEQYGGEPAIPLSDAKRVVLASMRLPEMLAEFKKLQRRVEKLEAEKKSE